MADTEVKRKGRPKKRDAEPIIELAVKKGAVSNGDEAAPPVKRGRGRPPKDGSACVPKKAKVTVPGRGRGRPPKRRNAKKGKKESEDDGDDDEDDAKKESSDDAESS